MKKGFLSLMIVLFLFCMFAIEPNAQEIQTGNEYNIVIIDNGEEVPLAAEMSRQPAIFSVFVPFAFLLIVLVVIVSTYLFQCFKYRGRIRLLFQKDNRTKKLGVTVNWNLFHLKDLENELENYLASSIHID